MNMTQKVNDLMVICWVKSTLQIDRRTLLFSRVHNKEIATSRCLVKEIRQ